MVLLYSSWRTTFRFNFNFRLLQFNFEFFLVIYNFLLNRNSWYATISKNEIILLVWRNQLIPVLTHISLDSISIFTSASSSSSVCEFSLHLHRKWFITNELVELNLPIAARHRDYIRTTHSAFMFTLYVSFHRTL